MRVSKAGSSSCWTSSCSRGPDSSGNGLDAAASRTRSLRAAAKLAASSVQKRSTSAPAVGVTAKAPAPPGTKRPFLSSFADAVHPSPDAAAAPRSTA